MFESPCANRERNRAPRATGLVVMGLVVLVGSVLMSQFWPSGGTKVPPTTNVPEKTRQPIVIKREPPSSANSTQVERQDEAPTSNTGPSGETAQKTTNLDPAVLKLVQHVTDIAGKYSSDHRNRPFLDKESAENVISLGTKVVPDLAQALVGGEPKTQDPTVLVNLCYCLAKIGGSDSAKVLKDFLIHHKSASEDDLYRHGQAIEYAIRGLCELKAQDSADLIRSYLAANDASIIVEAAATLLTWGQDDLDVLKAFARAEDPRRTIVSTDGSTSFRLEPIRKEFLEGRYHLMKWGQWIETYGREYEPSGFVLKHNEYTW